MALGPLEHCCQEVPFVDGVKDISNNRKANCISYTLPGRVLVEVLSQATSHGETEKTAISHSERFSDMDLLTFWSPCEFQHVFTDDDCAAHFRMLGAREI